MRPPAGWRSSRSTARTRPCRSRPTQAFPQASGGRDPPPGRRRHPRHQHRDGPHRVHLRPLDSAEVADGWLRFDLPPVLRGPQPWRPFTRRDLNRSPDETHQRCWQILTTAAALATAAIPAAIPGAAASATAPTVTLLHTPPGSPRAARRHTRTPSPPTSPTPSPTLRCCAGRDGWWYAFGTSDPLREGEGQPHLLPTARSRNLADWSYVGDARLARPAGGYRAQRRIWAPTSAT